MSGAELEELGLWGAPPVPQLAAAVLLVARLVVLVAPWVGLASVVAALAWFTTQTPGIRPQVCSLRQHLGDA